MCSGGGEGLAAVAGGLDALAAEDLCAVPGPALLDRIAALVAARNRLDAELARTVRRAEVAQAPERDGLKTMASWLRGHAWLSPAAASQLVRAGRSSSCRRSPPRTPPGRSPATRWACSPTWSSRSSWRGRPRRAWPWPAWTPRSPP